MQAGADDVLVESSSFAAPATPIAIKAAVVHEKRILVGCGGVDAGVFVIKHDAREFALVYHVASSIASR